MPPTLWHTTRVVPPAAEMTKQLEPAVTVWRRADRWNLRRGLIPCEGGGEEEEEERRWWWWASVEAS